MTRRVLVGMLVALCAWGLTAAGSLDELLSKSYEARGGLDNLKAVQSARMSGTMTIPGMLEAAITLEWKRPNKLRVELSTPEGNVVQVFDGENAWAMMPGVPAQKLPEAQAESLRRQSDIIDGPLVDWKEKGNSLEYLGEGELDGAPVEKLELTESDGTRLTLFFDAGNFLQIRQSGTTMVQGSESRIETTIGGYKKVGKLTMSHAIKTELVDLGLTQDLSLDSVELDVELPDDRFARPATPRAAGAEPTTN